MAYSDEQKSIEASQKARLRVRVQQLILLRETGPKSVAWHRARMSLMWRLHDELRKETDETEGQDSQTAAVNND